MTFRGSGYAFRRISSVGAKHPFFTLPQTVALKKDASPPHPDGIIYDIEGQIAPLNTKKDQKLLLAVTGERSSFFLVSPGGCLRAEGEAGERSETDEGLFHRFFHPESILPGICTQPEEKIT